MDIKTIDLDYKITTNSDGTPKTVNIPDLQNAIDSSQKGAANGVASLDGSGKVPSGELPSYVDDVIVVTTLPTPGEEGKIYITQSDNKSYRYISSTSSYAEISNPGTDWGDIGGTLSNQTDLQTALDGKVGEILKEDTTNNSIRIKDSIITAQTNGVAPNTPLGDNAIDLQGFRDDPAQTATGDNAIIGNGFENTANGARSSVLGGQSNTASGANSSVFGGYRNTASGANSSIIAGAINNANGSRSFGIGSVSSTVNSSNSGLIGTEFCIADGANSVIIGGRWNRTNGFKSIAIGGQPNTAEGVRSVAIGASDAKPIQDSEIAFGHHGGGKSGSSIATRTANSSIVNFTREINHTNNPSAPITTTSLTNPEYIVEEFSTVMFDIKVLGQTLDATEVFSYTIQAVVRNENSANPVQILSNTRTVLTRSDSEYDITLNPVSNGIEVVANKNNGAAFTIDWVANIQSVIMKFES